MNRSGNIGAAKNMDTVFADFTDDELEQDLMFDEDDQLVEIVEGFTEEGNTIFEEDQEIMKIADQIMNDDNTGDSPAEVKKDTEEILGPDNKTDQNIKDIEAVDDKKLDDSQTIDNLKKNGESEADKELGLDKLEDEYHSSATVEEAYEKWLHENPYEYNKENEAEGTDDTFGNKVDNSEIADDLKNTEDEKYQQTADASVKENAGDLGDENKAEGTDTVFGNKELDNTMPKDDIKPDEDENHNATNDASVKEAAEEGIEKKCDCGKDDCPICNPKAGDLAPDSAPVADVAADGERHEESNGESITDADGEGVIPGKVDDNTLPKEDEMTPDCSPKADNGDITDDGCKECENKEAAPEGTVEPEIKKEDDATAPITDETDKGEIKEACSGKGSDVSAATDDVNVADTATASNDEACGKGSGCAKECGSTSGTGLDNNVPVAGFDEAALQSQIESLQNQIKLTKMQNQIKSLQEQLKKLQENDNPDNVPVPVEDKKEDTPNPNVDPEETVDESFFNFLNERINNMMPVSKSLCIDENYKIINEDAFTIGLISAYSAVLIATILATSISRSDYKKIKEALKNYAQKNNDLILISKMKYKVFKLDKQLRNSNNSSALDNGKGEEDKGNIINRIFGTKIKATKPNRIVEYFYDDKPAFTIAYTVDSNRTNFVISYADQKFAKHDDYYNNKLLLDRGYISDKAESFVKKYKPVDEDWADEYKNESAEIEIPCPEAEKKVIEPAANKGDEVEVPETKIDGETPTEIEQKEVEKLGEATEEVEEPTKADINDAAKTEVEDAETELDDSLAAVADEPDGSADVNIEYDPTDEELLDDLDESFNKWLNN